MKSSAILFATFATLAVASPEAINHLLRARQSSTSCDENGFTKCASPYESAASGSCGQNLQCLCNAVEGLVGCINNFCPQTLPSEVQQALDACGIESSGSSSGSSGGSSGGSAVASNSAIQSDIGVIEPTGTGLDDPTATDDDFSTETSDDSDGSTVTNDDYATESDDSDGATATDDVVVTSVTSNSGSEATGAAGGGSESSDASVDKADATTTVEKEDSSATHSKAPQQSTGAAEALKAPAVMFVGALGVAVLL